MDKFKYIAAITREDVDKNIVIPCINSEGYHCILIKNAIYKTVLSTFTTDYLKVQLNAILYFEDKEYGFHIIESTKNDSYSLNQFDVIYEYIFRKIDEPILDTDFTKLIISLEDYFRITPEKDITKLQVGVFGELLAIKLLYDNGYENIIQKYHDNFYSKHDIEINNKYRIEIKTTSSEKRIHRFDHYQIYRDDIEVFIFSFIIEKAKEGISLLDLFDYVEPLFIDPDLLLFFEILKKQCNIGPDNPGLKISMKKTLNGFKIFNSKDLPKLELEIPEGITNIKYDVDCSLCNNINLDFFIKKLIEIDNCKDN